MLHNLNFGYISGTCRYFTRNLFANHLQKVRFIENDALQFVGLSQLSQSEQSEHYNQEVIALRPYLSLKHIDSVHLDILCTNPSRPLRQHMLQIRSLRYHVNLSKQTPLTAYASSL